MSPLEWHSSYEWSTDSLHDTWDSDFSVISQLVLANLNAPALSSAEISNIPTTGNETSDIPSTRNETSNDQVDFSSFVFPFGLFSLPDVVAPGFIAQPTFYDGKQLTEYRVTSPYHGHPIYSSSSNIPCANQDHSNTFFMIHQAHPPSYDTYFPHVMPTFNQIYPNTFHDNIYHYSYQIPYFIPIQVSLHYHYYEHHPLYPYIYMM
ncbi:hypothetical protein ZOSMA_115G00210 [Zostera marina]|uniref:Uncharacterized protein n=1 Tax=Zostera marina TaxID=29655 RepID=A0A0K9Q4J3_ZOSMR|nr:hypothetical protein ZOSMA_115G00210 [Zostera marina]